MHQRCLLMSLLLLWIVQSCQANQNISKQPEWISRYLDQYPSTQYICGKGVGDTFEIAKSMAMADLATYFDATVSSSINTAEQESAKKSKRKTTSTTESYFASQVKVFSSAKLQFAEVAETWKDPATKSYNVLVVMDRRKMCQFYQDKIMENEKLMTFYLNKNAKLLQKYAYLCKAAKVSKENELYYYYYDALANTQFLRLQNDYTPNKIEAMINETAQSICFDVSVNSDSTNIVLNAIKESIQKMGFSYGNNAELRMNIAITPTDSKKMGKQIFAGYTATMSICYQDQEVFTLSEQVQQGDTTLSLAKTRAVKALANALSMKLKNEFNKCLSLQ